MTLNLREKIIDILSNDTALYNEIIEYDNQIDEIFGIDYKKIESNILSNHKNSYTDGKLEACALYTSYFDFYKIAKELDLRKGQTFVDLGGGVSRAKLLYSQLNPDLDVISIDNIKERVEAGKNALLELSIDPNGYICEDLSICNLPQADYYFIYLLTGDLLDGIMQKLKVIANKRMINIIAIESHGDLIDTLKRDNYWLESVEFKSLSSVARHDQKIYHFKSLPVKDHQKVCFEMDFKIKVFLGKLYENGKLAICNIDICIRHQLIKSISNDKRLQFVIKEKDVSGTLEYLWIGNTWQVQNSLKEGFYYLKYPEREISEQSIEYIVVPDEKYLQWIDRRFLNEQFMEKGKILKIIISPVEQIEFSKSGRVDFEELGTCLE